MLRRSKKASADEGRNGPATLKLCGINSAVVPIAIGSGGLEFKWRNGRAVECGGLENRCAVSTAPGVRIPLSPPKASDQSRSLLRDFCFIKILSEACFSEGFEIKQKPPEAD
jgi:hypothetical protein